MRYYLERRDPEFEPKMAEVLCVYREVEMRRAAGGAANEHAIAVVSYDEKPGIQAIGTTAPDLPPVPGTHPTISRDHEYKRHGTVTLMAGIDLLTGQVHALVRDRHRSREFIEFLQTLDAAYPIATAIKIILDNHSAHVSRETKAWLAALTEGTLPVRLHPQAWLLAEPGRGLLRRAAPGALATSASTPNTNETTYHRVRSTTSIAIRSSIDGITKSISPLDP